MRVVEFEDVAEFDQSTIDIALFKKFHSRLVMFLGAFFGAVTARENKGRESQRQKKSGRIQNSGHRMPDNCLG